MKQGDPTGRLLRDLVKTIYQRMGYEIRRVDWSTAATERRPVGNMQTLLEDLRFRGLSPRASLDVGANQGSWSRLAKKIFPTLACFMIEPQIEMQNYLNAFCQEFPESRWYLAGAGDSSGEQILTVWDDLVGSSFLPAESEEWKRTGRQRSLTVVTIDSLLEKGEIIMPELVKLDVQGFELQVLQGGASLFGCTEVFIIEVSLFRFLEGQPLFHEVVQFMADRSYFVYDFPGFLRRPFDGSLGQVDICFVKQSGFLRENNRWE